MELKDQKQAPSSLLEGHGLYFNKILSRDSSVGQSSRIYYRNTNEGVPFKWEKQPGTPKHPRLKHENIIPPPSPPPAATRNMASGSPLRGPKDPNRWLSGLLWFFKVMKIKNKRNKRDDDDDDDDDDGFDDFDGNHEYSSSSSSSSLYSFSTSLNGSITPNFQSQPTEVIL